MLKKRIELEKTELAILLSWLKGSVVINNSEFRYNELLNKCVIDSSDNINVDGYFDDLMYDLYVLYEKLSKITSDQIEEKVVQNPLFNILPKEWLEESMRSLDSFLGLYEKLIMTSKFENIEIRGIQKNMINDLLNKFIANEDYEKCIELKENLKNV